MKRKVDGSLLFRIEFVEPKTLRERVYLHIREAIINNQLPAGKRIFDKEISKEFNVSITPVREALLQLSMEGFVQINSHREIVVKGISLKEIKEIYEVQGILEGFAGKLATNNLNTSQLSEMGKMTQLMAKYFEGRQIEKFYEVNEKIHDIFMKASDNRLIYDLVSNLNLRKKMFRYRLTFISKREAMEKSLQDHKKILKAFLSRDQDLVEQLIKKHWINDARIEDFREAMESGLSS